MMNMKKKGILLMTAFAVTALTLAGCQNPGNGEEKGTALGKEEAREVIVLQMDDALLAEKAWEELTAEERLRVRAKPEVLRDKPGDSEELAYALKLSMERKEPLRVIYFGTTDERFNGALLVYAVGNEFVAKSPRKPRTLATKADLDNIVKDSRTVQEVEERLEKGRKWAIPAYDSKEPPTKQKREPGIVPELKFYKIKENYYAIAHKGGVLNRKRLGKPESRIWTAKMIEERFGQDVLVNGTD